MLAFDLEKEGEMLDCSRESHMPVVVFVVCVCMRWYHEHFFWAHARLNLPVLFLQACSEASSEKWPLHCAGTGRLRLPGCEDLLPKCVRALHTGLSWCRVACLTMAGLQLQEQLSLKGTRSGAHGLLLDAHLL